MTENEQWVIPQVDHIDVICILELHESAASRERAVLHRDALREIECTNLSQRPLRQRSRVSVPSAHLLTAAEELTRANRPARLDLKPRQRLLTGKFHGDIDRPELAVSRRSWISNAAAAPIAAPHNQQPVAACHLCFSTAVKHKAGHKRLVHHTDSERKRNDHDN